MKISTGMEPRIEQQVIPERLNMVVFESGATLPTPSIQTRTLFIIRFWSKLLEETVETMLAVTQPEVEHKGCRIMVTKEHPEWARALEYDLKRYGVPDDAHPKITQSYPEHLKTYEYEWWELTL
jgi:hypothetical protein